MSSPVRFSLPPVNISVYKEECLYCFHSAETPGGLFLSLWTPVPSCYFSFCPAHVNLFLERHQDTQTGPLGLLHFVRKRIIKEDEEASPSKVTKLAIGMEGGFQGGTSVEFDDKWTMVTGSDLNQELDLEAAAERFGGEASKTVKRLMDAEGALRAQMLESGASLWDGEKRVKTTVSLYQVPNPPKIAPSGWECQWPECEFKNNLWLNLSDGKIFCGRSFFDGSGGHNHALYHYQKTNYPLAVKMGTVTPHGADVFSYKEDEMVSDPELSAHLAHFGIQMMNMEKTEKTMLELELDLNQKYEWAAIQESGARLRPLHGPGYTGLHNLGSSCYLNSVIQTLALTPEILEVYGKGAAEVFKSTQGDPATDFNFQMCKLIRGLESGDYSPAPPEEQAEGKKRKLDALEGIRPSQFRALVGRGHAEFSSFRQQDAEEYMRHLFDKIEQNLRPGASNPLEAFKFEIEKRLEDGSSGQVAYTSREERVLPLPIPMEAVINGAEVAAFEEKMAAIEATGQKMAPEEVVRPRVSLQSCLEAWHGPETIEDWRSPVSSDKTTAKVTHSFKTFPDFLIIQAKKFTVTAEWTPSKLDVELDVAEELDLDWLRGKGPQPDEVMLPEEAAAGKAAAAAPEIDASVLADLLAMGFPESKCRRSVTESKNSGLEAAINWLMEHMDEEEPMDAQAIANPTLVAQLTPLGFSSYQADYALRQTNMDPNAAAEWLFMNADNIPPEPAPMETGQRDGVGRYKLVGFISHMGSNAQSGHYVCHLWKDGRWVIFNDEKVACSEKPPKGLAYIYLFRRQT